MLSVVHLLVILAAAVGQAQESTARPRALVALEEARRELVSGRIEWTRTDGESGDVMRFVSRYAVNGDAITEFRGDADGWTMRDRNTGEGTSKFPRLYLRNEQGTWLAAETSISARLFPKADGGSGVAGNMKDVRYLGVYATSATLEPGTGFSEVWSPEVHPITEWHEERVNGKWVVTGKSPSGATKTWTIDPERGWNAERVTLQVGQTRAEAVIVLQQYGEAWLPQRTVFMENGRVLETIEITHAACNQPGDRPSFNLTDLGMDVGTQISDGREGAGLLYWTGDELISSQQWHADVKAGKRDYGPNIKRFLAGDHDSPYMTDQQRAAGVLAATQFRVRVESTRHEGLWEAYVRAFIARYGLSDDQSQQAYRILRSCQTRASELISRQSDRPAVVSELLDARKKQEPERIERLQKRFAALNEPIESIFQEELKPRLEKLPTREQRRRAAETQPSAKPGQPTARPATSPR